MTVAAIAAILFGDYLEAGIVIFILLFGEYLEEITIAKTGEAIKGLSSLIPDTVKLKDGTNEKEILSKEIKVDDVIIIRSGEYIPIDGVVVRGEATIDQSLITGESIAVEKNLGDDVYS